MRALLPEPAAEVDLRAAYATPADRSWVRANMVCSLDGAMSLAGRTGGLSGPADKRLFDILRSLADVVLVGAGTVRTEGYGPSRHAPMAVVSASLTLDPGSELFAAAAPHRTLLVTSEQAAADHAARGGRLFDQADVVTTPGSGIDLAAAVDALHARGLRQVLCEGGPVTLAALVAAGRLDELCLTLSPLLVAGDAGRILSGGPLAPPAPMVLAHLLEDEGFLFSRWVRP